MFVVAIHVCTHRHIHTHILSLTLTYIHTHAHTFIHTQLAMLKRETSDKAKVCYKYVTVQFETLDQLGL